MQVRDALSSHSSVCVGSGLIALDVIFNGKRAERPIFTAGGSCCNVLTILSYLGWKSYPIARLGRDIEGRRVIEDMKHWNVKTKFVAQESNTSTPRIIEKVFLGDRPKHRFYLKCEHGNWLPQRKAVLLKYLERMENQLPKSQVFYFDRASPSTLLMAKQQKENGALIFFEPPKFSRDDLFLECLKIADIVKHCYKQSKETENTGISIPTEIQTMGEKGLRYKTKLCGQRKWTYLPPYSVENLVDAAGSGDWLTAGMIYILGKKWSKKTISKNKLETALNIGQFFAALNCNYVGARGMMYYLSKQKLFNLTKKMLNGDRKLSFKKNDSILPMAAKTRIASQCQICLCD